MSRARPTRSVSTARTLATLLAALALLLIAATGIGYRPRAAAQARESIVMIIAASTGISDIPADLLRTTFRGLPVQYHGFRLIPFNAPLNTPMRVRVDRLLLALEPENVGSFWVDQRVRDGRTPPRTAPTVELALRVVAHLPGAISYVPASALADKVKALKIDGKGPQDAKYLLKD